MAVEMEARSLSPRPAWWLCVLAAGFPSVVVVHLAMNLFVANAAELSGGRAELRQISLFALGVWLLNFLALMWGGRPGKTLWSAVTAYAVFTVAREVAFPLPIGQIDGMPLPPPRKHYLAAEVFTYLAALAVLLRAPLGSTTRLAAVFTAVFAVSTLVFFTANARSLLGTDTPDAAPPAASVQASAASDQPNIYHVLFDEYQTVEYQWTQKQRGGPPYEDFLFFKNTISNYNVTYLSYPTIFTGTLYAPDRNFYDWVNSYQNEGLIKDLKDKRYRTHLYGLNRRWWRTSLADETRYSADIADEWLKGKPADDFFMLVKLRCSPCALGSRMLEQSRQRVDASEPPPALDIPFYSARLFRELVADIEKTPPRGQYVFIHMILPHGPEVLDEDGHYVGRERGTRIGQVLFANKLIGELVAQLKRLGRYDDSLIVVHSDHGYYCEPDLARQSLVGGTILKLAATYGDWSSEEMMDGVQWKEPVVKARSQALLLIKPPHHHGYGVVDMPCQVLDIAPTILGVLGDNDPEDRYEGIDVLRNFPGADRECKTYVAGAPVGGRIVLRLQEYSVRNGQFRRGAIVPIHANAQRTFGR